MGPFAETLRGPARPWEPPRFYAWQAPHACGVTDRQERALDGVREALRDEPPGTVAQIRRVTVNGCGTYIDVGAAVTAALDAASGALVWDVA